MISWVRAARARTRLVRRSLRAQMFGWLLGPLALIVAVNAWLAYESALETATVVQDRLLLGSARIIGENVRLDDGAFQVEIPPAALELFQSRAHDRVYYRVVSPRGFLLSGYAELPPPTSPIRTDESMHFDVSFRGEPLRAVAFAQPVFSPNAEGPVVIEVAQTLNGRGILAMQIWGNAMRQQLLLIPLSVIFLGIGLHRGLGPLVDLRDRMLARAPGALQTLDTRQVPNELKPLVLAVNDYVRRLDDHMAVHSRFIANAAHQLRTPLAVFNTQVNYALSSAQVAEKDEALHAIEEGLQHAIRVVNQLLTLSRAESDPTHLAPQSSVNLADEVRKVLEKLAGFAQAKHIDLGFDLKGSPGPVRAVPAMLRELIANLVDNALRYTPEGGTVTAIVSAQADGVRLVIEDDGPGIPAAERDRVFERFYRLRPDTVDGCGLGLAIVREIAASCGATVELSSPDSGEGLVVVVHFPTA